MKKIPVVCFGEFMGTFILVFIGTGAVATAVLFDAFTGLMQVALMWGLGVTLAIYSSRHLSCAHLNPAVTVGMVLAGRMERHLAPWYIISQLGGGIAAGAVVLALFNGSIIEFEAAHSITRGTYASVKTAMMFGEYFPNPAMAPQWLTVTPGVAAFAEGLGTFLLVFIIFVLTEGCNVGRPAEGVSPVFIGGTVSAIIGVLAPLTQAGINPARDFGPRIVAYLAGWDSVAIPGPDGGFFVVYILAPILGGVAAAAVFKYVAEPLMWERTKQLDCVCSPPVFTRDKTVGEG